MGKIVDHFEEGKYYRWVGTTDKPEARSKYFFNPDGEMDAILDGRPRKAINITGRTGTNFFPDVICEHANWSWGGAALYDGCFEEVSSLVVLEKIKNKIEEKKWS